MKKLLKTMGERDATENVEEIKLQMEEMDRANQSKSKMVGLSEMQRRMKD